MIFAESCALSAKTVGLISDVLAEMVLEGMVPRKYQYMMKGSETDTLRLDIYLHVFVFKVAS